MQAHWLCEPGPSQKRDQQPAATTLLPAAPVLGIQYAPTAKVRAEAGESGFSPVRKRLVRRIWQRLTHLDRALRKAR